MHVEADLWETTFLSWVSGRTFTNHAIISVYRIATSSSNVLYWGAFSASPPGGALYLLLNLSLFLTAGTFVAKKARMVSSPTESV